MTILAIETSCDETSVAVVEDGHRLLSLVVNSQIDLHKAFGGVVPEVAARSHIEVMIPVVQVILKKVKDLKFRFFAPLRMTINGNGIKLMLLLSHKGRGCSARC